MILIFLRANQYSNAISITITYPREESPGMLLLSIGRLAGLHGIMNGPVYPCIARSSFISQLANRETVETACSRRERIIDQFLGQDTVITGTVFAVPRKNGSRRRREPWRGEERRKREDKGGRKGARAKDGWTCCDFHQSGTRSAADCLSAEVKSDTDLEGNTAR